MVTLKVASFRMLVTLFLVLRADYTGVVSVHRVLNLTAPDLCTSAFVCYNQ